MKESYSTVRHSINPRGPCESRQTLIPVFRSGLKPFLHNQGRILAFSLELLEGFAPPPSNYQFAALLLSYKSRLPF